MTLYNNLIDNQKYTICNGSHIDLDIYNRNQFVTINNTPFRIVNFKTANRFTCENICRLAVIVSLVILIVPLFFAHIRNLCKETMNKLANDKITLLYATNNSIVPPRTISIVIPDYLQHLPSKVNLIAEDIESCLREKPVGGGFQNPIHNNTLTEALSIYAYEEVWTDDLNIINVFLKRIVNLALAGDANAYELLKRPNNYGQKVDGNDGYPQNTPLHLLVKGVNFEGALTILPMLQKTDLLATTPHGNTALHLAIISGQINLALNIMKRAEELGTLQDILNVKNALGKTAGDMLALFKDPKNTFKKGDAIHDEYVSYPNEEMRKSRACDPHNESFFNQRSKAMQEMDRMDINIDHFLDINALYVEVKARYGI